MVHGTRAGAMQRWMDKGCPQVPMPTRRGSMRSVRVIPGFPSMGPVFLSRPAPKHEAKKGWLRTMASKVGSLFGRRGS